MGWILILAYMALLFFVAPAVILIGYSSEKRPLVVGYCLLLPAMLFFMDYAIREEAPHLHETYSMAAGLFVIFFSLGALIVYGIFISILLKFLFGRN